MKTDFLWALNVNIEFLWKTLWQANIKPVQGRHQQDKLPWKPKDSVFDNDNSKEHSKQRAVAAYNFFQPQLVYRERRRNNFHFTGKLYDRFVFFICFLGDKKETKMVWRHLNWWQIKRVIWAYKDMSSSIQSTRNLRWWDHHLDFSENILKMRLKHGWRAEYVKVGSEGVWVP